MTSVKENWSTLFLFLEAYALLLNTDVSNSVIVWYYVFLKYPIYGYHRTKAICLWPSLWILWNYMQVVCSQHLCLAFSHSIWCWYSVTSFDRENSPMTKPFNKSFVYLDLDVLNQIQKVLLSTFKLKCLLSSEALLIVHFLQTLLFPVSLLIWMVMHAWFL